MEETTSARSAPRRWLRRSIVIAVLLIGVVLIFPTLVYEWAKHKLEGVTGPLEASRFNPPSLPAGNAGDRLREAARQLAFSPDQRSLLTGAVKGGPAALRAQRQPLAALLELNRDALRMAASLPPGPARLKIAYEAKDWSPRDLSLQLPLTQLLYARGALALDDGDAATTLVAVRSLGRQAEILEGEPGLIIQLYGFAAEKYQLQLAAALLETVAGDPTPFVLSNDLCRQYRDAITLQATGLDRALWAGMAEASRDAQGKGFLGHLKASWLQWTAPLVGAEAFNRYRVYLQACVHDYGWIEKHLENQTVNVHVTLGKGKVPGPDYPNVVARYRAAAGSRALIRESQKARATLQAGGTCDAIGKTLRTSRLEASDGPSGCTLRVVDGKEYLRHFVASGATAFPQECVLKKP